MPVSCNRQSQLHQSFAYLILHQRLKSQRRRDLCLPFICWKLHHSILIPSIKFSHGIYSTQSKDQDVWWVAEDHKIWRKSVQRKSAKHKSISVVEIPLGHFFFYNGQTEKSKPLTMENRSPAQKSSIWLNDWILSEKVLHKIFLYD